MAEIKLIETFDDSNVIAELDKIEKQLVDIGQAGEKAGAGVAGGLAQAAQGAREFEKAVDKTTSQSSALARTTEVLNRNLTAFKAKIGDTIQGTEIAGKSVADWKEQLGQVGQLANSVAGNTDKMTTAQKLFNIVLKASPLGILLGVVSAIIVYFSRFQEGIDKVSRVTAAAFAVFDKLTERVATLGKGLVQFVTGDISGGVETMKSSFTGLADEIQKTATRAYELEAAFQALRDEEIATRAEIARSTANMERLMEIGEDETLTYGRRIKALREAGQIESKLNTDRVAIAQKNFDLIKEQNSILADNVERREKLADAEVELIEAQAEQERNAREIAKLIREVNKERAEEAKAAREEEAKRIEALRKEYEKLIGTVTAQNRALSLENEDSPVLQLERQWKEAIKQAETLRSELYRLAPTDEDRVFVDQQISELLGRINKKYVEELEKVKQEIADERRAFSESLNPLPPADVAADDFERRARETVAKYGPIKDEFVSETQAILEEIAEAFNLRGKQVIDVNEANQLFSGLKLAFADAYEGYQTLQQVQLELSQQKIDQFDAELEAQKEKIDAEREAAEEGLANNLADEQKRQAQLLAQRKKAAQENLNLQRKQAAVQLAADSLQQASSLATAAGNIIKAESNKGLLGVAFAISAIAFLFKIFAQAKANAVKFSAPPQLRKGAKLEGPTHEEGGIDIVMGNRVRYEAEKGEWLIGTKPSKRHDKFLRRLNDGEFDNMDLERVVSRTGSMSEVTTRNTVVRAITRTEVGYTIGDVIKEVKRTNKSITTAVEGRPYYDGTGVVKGGGVVRTKKR